MIEDNYLEKKLKSIYKTSFIIAGMSILLFITFVFMFHRTKNGYYIVIPAFIFIITGTFGYIILIHTKKSLIVKVLTFFGLLFVILVVLVGGSLEVGWARSKEISESMRSINDAVAIKQYNLGFTDYEGQTNVRGDLIRDLIKNVMTHNRSFAKELADDPSLWIQVRVSDKTGNSPLEEAESMIKNSNDAEKLSGEDLTAYNENIKNELKKINSSKVYAVACGYDPQTGYVTDIVIVPVKN